MNVYRHATADWREILIEDGRDGRVFAKITDQKASGYHSITLPADERQAAAQALAGDEYRVVPRDLTVGDLQQIMDLQVTADVRERCPACNHEPDRPEPVDPASVRVGDYVHVESVDRYVNIGPEWAVQGAIGQDHGSLVSIRTDDGWISVSRGHGVWYVLQPAEPEPEPDEAAVEALYQAIYRTPEGQRQVRDNQDGRADEYRAIAEGLVRAGLEVPSDG